MLSIDIQLMYVIYIIHIYIYDKLETALMNCQPLSPSLSQATISNAIFNCTHKSQQKAENRMFRFSFFIFTKKLKLHFAHQEQTNKNPS